MNKSYHIRVDDLDLGQIIDGLSCREESWRNTASYLRDNCSHNESFVCEECRDAEEAAEIADRYRRIIEGLQKQRDLQKKGETPNDERRIYLQGKADGQDNLIVRILADWTKMRSLGETAVANTLRRLTDQIYDG